MAMEPLGSIMSVQVQSQVQTKPAAQPAKSSVEYTDVSAQETVTQVDNTTNVVTGAQEKGGSGSNEGGKQQTDYQVERYAQHND